jgi:hypothetical protein
MAFSFMRGRQMVIHDPRLANPFTTPPTLLRPPHAMNVWTVNVGDKAEGIINFAGEVAKGKLGTEKLDALHFMAHGAPGSLQIGADGLGWGNVDLFKKLNGRIQGAIIFFSCQVGADQSGHSLSYGMTFGNAVAAYAGCKALTCQMNQIFSWNGSNVIDFGSFEGPVYVYAPDGSARMMNYSAKSNIDIESIVFS